MDSSAYTSISSTRMSTAFMGNDMTTTTRHDLNQIRDLLRAHIESVLKHLFPAGCRKGHTFVVGDVHGNPGESLVVECEGDRCGLWQDFATNEGGDLIDLWAAYFGLNAQSQFPAVLDQIATWLGIRSDEPDHTDNALSQTQWDYLDRNHNLIARVYRHDTPKGKQYRPWDAANQRFGMPSPRPLYRLPDMQSADTVILVEGEKCADALVQLGHVATTAMGGASAPLDKTDWTPLMGKSVILWPDNDTVGERYIEKLIQYLPEKGVRELRRINIPKGKPAKWDAADAQIDGTDVHALVNSALVVEGAHKQSLKDWHAVDRFIGQPQERQWLVNGIFPQAQASLLAASGGVGKSYLLLALARAVAGNDGTWLNAPMMFGGSISTQGGALYITAEDDAIELHSRLNALGEIPSQLYVVPLPDAGGAKAFFAPDAHTKVPATTKAWGDLLVQLEESEKMKLVIFDPLQPLCALDLNVPENAQFVCSRIGALAAKTGAAVIISHHFAKREVNTPEQAREAIRGTGGLVDGVRSVYALWNAREDESKAIVKQLALPYQRAAVVRGGVVKANGKANLNVTTYVRDARGLLQDRSSDLQRIKTGSDDLMLLLKQAIAQAVLEGKPYTKTGVNGVYGRRFEMAEPLHPVGKHSFSNMIDTLLARGQIVQAMADNSKSVKWLDVPDGPLAQGEPIFTAGFIQHEFVRKSSS